MKYRRKDQEDIVQRKGNHCDMQEIAKSAQECMCSG